MIREQFFSDKTDGISVYPDPDKFMDIWDKVTGYESEIDKTLDEGYTRDEYIGLFMFVRSKISASFVLCKDALVLYISYLVQNGALTQEFLDNLNSITFDGLKAPDSERIIYYKNLDMLKEAIGETLEWSNCSDISRYDTQVAILYLAWYGLTMDQILDLPKTAVTENGIEVNGQTIKVEDFVLRHLTRYKKSEGYRQRAREIIFRKYKESDYLVRSNRSDHLDKPKLRVLLHDINSILNGVYSLCYSTVYYSGVFFRVYMKECNGAELDFKSAESVSELFHENLSDRRKRLNRLNEYQCYKRLFF